MATKESVAKTCELAIQSLKESGAALASLTGIEQPDLSFSYRDKDYQQAQEMRVLAAFYTTLRDALEAQAAAEGSDDGGNTKAPTKKSRRNG